jgi:uncharacterized protein (TIGR02118 family)
MIYRRVDDPEALETFFSKTHLVLAEKLPGLVKSEVGRVTGKPGGESRFHLLYELYFERAEARIVSWFYADAYAEEAGLRGPGGDA